MRCDLASLLHIASQIEGDHGGDPCTQCCESGPGTLQCMIQCTTAHTPCHRSAPPAATYSHKTHHVTGQHPAATYSHKTHGVQDSDSVSLHTK